MQLEALAAHYARVPTRTGAAMVSKIEEYGVDRPLPEGVVRNEKHRMFIPYWVSAVLAQKYLHKDEYWSAWIGLVAHVATWGFVVVYDSWLLAREFNEEGSMKNLLQLAATVTVWIAGGLVIVLSLLQMLFNCCYQHSKSNHHWSWNDGLLPPFLSSGIIASVRASLEFTKFLLFFAIFEPVLETQGENRVSMHIKNVLIVLVVLKQYGISMTMAQHRTKVYDDNHEPVSMGISS